MKYTNKIIFILLIIIILIVGYNFYTRYSIIKRINDAKDLIVIETPKPYQKVQNPIYIKGKVKGNFFFEATFPVRIEDENGNIVKNSYIMTKENWMSEDFVSFETTINIDELKIKRGFIIFEKANPSGLKENKFLIKIPVYFE